MHGLDDLTSRFDIAQTERFQCLTHRLRRDRCPRRSRFQHRKTLITGRTHLKIQCLSLLQRRFQLRSYRCALDLHHRFFSRFRYAEDNAADDLSFFEFQCFSFSGLAVSQQAANQRPDVHAGCSSLLVFLLVVIYRHPPPFLQPKR
ncbi:hypothetical protein PSAB_14915 [Paenibacillus sabinae T27]|uniref:Uncharacterized protein n=1 Tax=Paenibacillus sabinae T27 TaxID=1268072 RepID=X4ZKT5_9BACL|nr:hypothetical protein PSAB_14915 [Paenibacillus sabinae T27]